MTPAPCYDVVNKQDCPNRKWCLAHGRSKCEKWAKYEQIHKAEKDAIYQDKLVYQADREAVKAGDIIKEKDTYYQVIAIDVAKNRIKAANLSTGTESNIKIETNIFTGQKMYRKVFSFFNMVQNQQGTANPMMGGTMGMMNPMALMMLDSFGDSGDDAMKAMAMMSMMNPQAGQGMMNPMMMYFMMGDSKDGDGNDWIKMMAMGSMMQQMGGAMNPFNGMMGNQQVPGQMNMDQFKQDDVTPQDATDEDWDENEF